MRRIGWNALPVGEEMPIGNRSSRVIHYKLYRRQGKEQFKLRVIAARRGSLQSNFLDASEILCFRRPDLPVIKSRRTFRNPLIYAIELQEELVRDDLTRKQLAERHGITSDRVTQWLCLLKSLKISESRACPLR